MSDVEKPALRSRAWFDNPANIDMTALYLERYLNFGISLDELRSLLEVRDRLADEHDDDARATLVDRLDGYADTAAERCSLLREQLEGVEAVTRTLQREAKAARRRSNTTRTAR